MSIMRCEKHSRHWDSDFLEECPICLQNAFDELPAPKIWNGWFRGLASGLLRGRFIWRLIYWVRWKIIYFISWKHDLPKP